jgi:hypothetical protein
MFRIVASFDVWGRRKPRWSATQQSWLTPRLFKGSVAPGHGRISKGCRVVSGESKHVLLMADPFSKEA